MKINFKIKEVNYKNTLKLSVMYKVVSLGVPFILTPIIIANIGKNSYGFWATLLSILSWITLFDIGITNGIRKTLSYYVNNSEYNKARALIGQAVWALSIVASLFTVICITFITTNSVVFTTFKSHGVGVFELLVLFIAISFSFVCSLTNIVANVNHQASVKERGLAISSITSLIAVTFLSINNSLDLNGLIISQSLALGIGGLCNSMLFFKKNKQLRPSIISFRFDELRLLAKISMLFMVTQISYLILFTTDRLLIGSLTGFESSAEYDLIYKILSAFLILHGLINAPLWGVYSKRFIRREMALIRNSLANQMKIFSLFLMAIVVCTSLLKYIFCFWLGSQFTYSLVGAVSVALFITIYVWSNVFSIFLNSIDDLKLQVYCSVVGAVVNIPLSMFMVNVLSFGYEGVVMSTIICLLPFATLAPIKVYKITATRKGLYE